MDALKEAAVRAARRLVIKIGSALLVEGGRCAAWLSALMADLTERQRHGNHHCFLWRHSPWHRQIGYNPADLILSQSQAAAAVGQIALAEAYQNTAAPHDLTIAQILLLKKIQNNEAVI